MRSALLGVVAGLVVLAAAAVYLLGSLPAGRVGDAPLASPSGAISSPSRAAPSATGSVNPPTPPRAPSQVSPSASPSATEPPPVGLGVGSTAPELTVPQLGGGTIDLALLRGRALWINFTASWCPTCRDELPVMQRMQRELGERMTVIVVDVQEDEDTVASLASELNLTLPVGMDLDGRVQRTWRAFALPVHYWLDRDGTIRGVVYGGAGPEQLLEGVRTVVPDASLAP